MKRLLVFISSIGFANFAVAQIMQASIGVGSTPTRVKIYMKPDIAVSGQLSTVNFDVAIPSITPGPTPTLTITNDVFPTALFQIFTPYVESGYIHYNIANLSPFNVSIGAGTETLVLELQFDGNPANSAIVSLVTLPDEGNIGFALFYCTGAAGCDGSNLYYFRSGTSGSNQFSYTYPSFVPPGTSISHIDLTTLTILPIKWLGFNAVKQNNDGLINWSVAEEDITNHYELQRSLNGVDFVTVANINKTGTGSVTQNYTYTDPGITALGSALIFYRLKEVDLDGKYVYSDIRKINISLKTDVITVYPNPVKDGFYVDIPFLQRSTTKNIQLILTNGGGQTIQTKEISSLQATNYYFDLKGLSLASGNYFLQIIHDGTLLDRKQLFVNKE